MIWPLNGRETGSYLTLILTTADDCKMVYCLITFDTQLKTAWFGVIVQKFQLSVLVVFFFSVQVCYIQQPAVNYHNFMVCKLFSLFCSECPSVFKTSTLNEVSWPGFIMLRYMTIFQSAKMGSHRV